MWLFSPLNIINKKKYQSLSFKSAYILLFLHFHGKNSKNPSLCCFKEGKKFFAASTMHLRTYLKNKAVGKSENRRGISSKLVGIICVPG